MTRITNHCRTQCFNDVWGPIENQTLYQSQLFVKPEELTSSFNPSTSPILPIPPCRRDVSAGKRYLEQHGHVQQPRQDCPCGDEHKDSSFYRAEKRIKTVQYDSVDINPETPTIIIISLPKPLPTSTSIKVFEIEHNDFQLFDEDVVDDLSQQDIWLGPSTSSDKSDNALDWDERNSAILESLRMGVSQNDDIIPPPNSVTSSWSDLNDFTDLNESPADFIEVSRSVELDGIGEWTAQTSYEDVGLDFELLSAHDGGGYKIAMPNEHVRYIAQTLNSFESSFFTTQQHESVRGKKGKKWRPTPLGSVLEE